MMTLPIGKLSEKDEKAMWAKAKSLGLPSQLVVPAMQSFLKWGESSGWEFAISRFKAMKTNLLRIIAGLDPLWEQGEYPRKGIPWFKGLVTLSRRGDALLSKCASLLNMYTSLIFSVRTNKQQTKFKSGLDAEPVPISNRFSGQLLNVTTQLPRPKAVKSAKWFLNTTWSESRRTPSVSLEGDSLNLFVTKPEIGGVVDSMLYLLAGVRGADILELVDLYPDFAETLQGLMQFQNKSLVAQLGHINLAEKPGLLGGTISFIQEAGGKLRSVANPYRWWQSALDPLADAIHDILRQVPWDCTHNQSKPVLPIQKSLRKGDEWFSVDISSATDHFPLDYQVQVLEYLFQGDTVAQSQIGLFRAVSRMPWWYRDDSGELQYVTWQKGQPMGLRPSFGSFALTHGLVLFALNHGKWEEDFFVLGDDVVIKGQELHRRYRHWLMQHQIPVAEAKTLSGRVAEFASTIITSESAIPIYKWRRTTPDNFVDLARLWGPSALPLFTREERKVLNKLSNVPPIYGGLGFGDPTTWDYSIPQWISKRIGRSVDTSLIRSYIKQVYSSQVVSETGVVPVIDTSRVDDYTQTLQRFVVDVMQIDRTTVDNSFLKAMAPNIIEIYDVFLPSAGWDGNISTKLDLWKRRLNLK
jgi:hypothetical protein